MSVVNELRGLRAKAQNYRGQSLSEKDTERLLVEPFIDALGYDTRDLGEVETQPRIQVGSTEVKCDYAIKRDGAPLILIECKKAGFRLDALGQLSTYFERERAVWLGVYTNGLEHRFYGGSVSGAGIKQMDAQPFLTLDLLNFDERVAGQVAAFAKDQFDPTEVRTLAQNIRDRRKIENALREELRTPSDGLVRLVMEKVGADRGEVNRYKPIVQDVAPQLLSNAQPQHPATPATPSSASPSSVAAMGATPTGIPIRWVNRGQTYEAILLEHGHGSVWVDGHECSTPSAACQRLLPRRPANGWTEWEYFDQHGQDWLPIGGLRGLSEEEQIRRAGASIGFVPPPQPRPYRRQRSAGNGHS